MKTNNAEQTNLTRKEQTVKTAKRTILSLVALSLALFLPTIAQADLLAEEAKFEAAFTARTSYNRSDQPHQESLQRQRPGETRQQRRPPGGPPVSIQ